MKKTKVLIALVAASCVASVSQAEITSVGNAEMANVEGQLKLIGGKGQRLEPIAASDSLYGGGYNNYEYNAQAEMSEFNQYGGPKKSGKLKGAIKSLIKLPKVMEGLPDVKNRVTSATPKSVMSSVGDLAVEFSMEQINAMGK